MSVRLRVLHLEDDPLDAELIRETLASSGLDCELTRVDVRAAFERALGEGKWDLILSDYTLPSYDGGSALAFARAARPDVPFILVSGTMGEEAAIAGLLGGATDYVLKGGLHRLVPAVQRALREAEERRARRQAEEAVFASELRYRRLFEASKDGILMLEAERGRIIDANPSLLALLGRARGDVVGRAVQEIGLFEPASEAASAFEELQRVEYRRFPELRLRSQLGEALDVDLVSTAYEVGGQRVVQCNLRDISEQKRLAEQLRQAQKLEAVGQLAGGVAHDFNNLLLVINGYAEMVRDALPAGDPLRADLDEIRRAGERGAALTRQLLAFSRKQILQPVVLSLNAVVGEVEKLLRRVIGEDVSLRIALGEQVGNVRADPAQLEQVVMNLVLNSRDAMPQGGTVVVSTLGVELDDAYARTHPGVAPGAYVCLSVADTGCGMDEATRARMFEPFFTTKGLGKGTGLGLSTVYGIVRQSGGHVEVDTAPGQGTVVRIYLPREQAQAPEQPSSVPAATAGGTETVLLVEDDEGVRTLGERVLRPLGYEVLSARNGEEALDLAERRDGPVHLLVTDVILPGMDGGELARQLLAHRPQLKVLYVSGYTDDHLLNHGAGQPPWSDLLQKPFTPDALARRIRATLGEPGAQGVAPAAAS